MSLPAGYLLICLSAAHVLGEFLIQAGQSAQENRQAWNRLRHALTAAVLSYILCGAWTAWLVPAGVFAAHAGAGIIKARLHRQDAVSFLLEQCAHAAVLLAIALAAAPQAPVMYGVAHFGTIYLKALLLVAGVTTSVFGGGILIGLAVEPLLDEMKRSTPANDTVTPESRGLEHGGKLIGWLERALIFLFVLGQQPASVGFLVAAKSIFRFGELKEHHQRMEAEYIIIGTMMSFGFGLLVSFLDKFPARVRLALAVAAAAGCPHLGLSHVLGVAENRVPTAAPTAAGLST